MVAIILRRCSFLLPVRSKTVPTISIDSTDGEILSASTVVQTRHATLCIGHESHLRIDQFCEETLLAFRIENNFCVPHALQV